MGLTPVLLALVAFVRYARHRAGPLSFCWVRSARRLKPSSASIGSWGSINRCLSSSWRRPARWPTATLRFSYFFRRPALEVVAERFPATLLLSACAWVLSSLAGVAAGVAAARRRNSNVDRLLSSGAVAVLATPNFWMAIVLIVVFAAWLHLLPSAGMAPVG